MKLFPTALDALIGLDSLLQSSKLHPCTERGATKNRLDNFRGRYLHLLPDPPEGFSVDYLETDYTKPVSVLASLDYLIQSYRWFPCTDKGKLSVILNEERLNYAHLLPEAPEGFLEALNVKDDPEVIQTTQNASESLTEPQEDDNGTIDS